MNKILKRNFVLVMVITTHTLFAQQKNSKLTEVPAGTSPLGTSVTIGSRKPGNIIVGVGGKNTFYTTDAGVTWKPGKKTSSPTEALEPDLLTDPAGDFYFFYSTNQEEKTETGTQRKGISYIKSMNSGSVWSPTEILGDAGTKIRKRPMVGPHYLSGKLYATWTEFDSYPSQDSVCQSNLFFSQSANDGKRWSDPIQINKIPGNCRDSANTVWGTAPLISTESRVFVCWTREEHVYFDRSYDGGKTWLGTDVEIAKQKGGSLLAIPGVSKLHGAPVLVLDNSASFFRSSLYVVWCDQSKGKDDADIWMSRSTSRGDLWSPPIRVNQDDPGKQQFGPWMTVDQSSGIIYFAYYDRRAYDDARTDVYLAYSINGGKNFKEVKISAEPFTPSADSPFADHVSLAAVQGTIAVSWVSQSEKNNQVWVEILKQGDLISKEDAPKLQQLKPVPYHKGEYTTH